MSDLCEMFSYVHRKRYIILDFFVCLVLFFNSIFYIFCFCSSVRCLLNLKWNIPISLGTLHVVHVLFCMFVCLFEFNAALKTIYYVFEINYSNYWYKHWCHLVYIYQVKSVFVLLLQRVSNSECRIQLF